MNATTAFANNLSYVTSDNKVIMKGDDTTTLQSGQFRQRYSNLNSPIAASVHATSTASESQVMRCIISASSY